MAKSAGVYLASWVEKLTSDLAKAFGTNTQQGAFVNQVMPDQPPMLAGIKPGDIIVKLNGKAVPSFGELLS